MLSNLERDETSMQLQIDKKTAELERQQKRLRSLEAVRPSWMDEYET